MGFTQTPRYSRVNAIIRNPNMDFDGMATVIDEAVADLGGLHFMINAASIAPFEGQIGKVSYTAAKRRFRCHDTNFERTSVVTSNYRQLPAITVPDHSLKNAVYINYPHLSSMLSRTASVWTQVDTQGPFFGKCAL